MKLVNFMCDRCGKDLLNTEEANYKWSLQVYFPNMSHKDSNHNLGLKHLCTNCRDTFIKTFRRWFKFYNNVKKGQIKWEKKK